MSCYFTDQDLASRTTNPTPTAVVVNTDKSSLEYVSLPSGSLVTCRVCQASIDITDKREQHVVKCGHCSEATVSDILVKFSGSFSVGNIC